MENDQFVFEGYESNFEKGEVIFYFTLKANNRIIDFTEKVSFPPVDSKKIHSSLLKSILDNLMLILGISYWKTYCPRDIKLKGLELSRERAEFWNTIYTKGMGEFYYKNKIDFRGLVNFPYEDIVVKPILYSFKNRYLLGVGGGKDSIVVAEMFKKENKEFDLLTEDSQIKKSIAKLIGKPTIIMNRKLDTKLLELNKKKGVYNGHIPVSAIYAFCGILCAALYDYKYLAVGNEKSANYGNVKYLGQIINHQWSKSFEFEKLFNNYLQNFVTKNIYYFSPLRNMNELEITREFVNYPKYFNVFSSCNRNFRIVYKSDNRWCGECAKCLFVFIMLSAFLPKEKVLSIFEKNLFEDENLISTLKELIAIKDFKPFECVGEPVEVKEALSKIIEKGDFDDTKLIKFYKTL